MRAKVNYLQQCYQIFQSFLTVSVEKKENNFVWYSFLKEYKVQYWIGESKHNSNHFFFFRWENSSTICCCDVWPRWIWIDNCFTIQRKGFHHPQSLHFFMECLNRRVTLLIISFLHNIREVIFVTASKSDSKIGQTILFFILLILHARRLIIRVL